MITAAQSARAGDRRLRDIVLALRTTTETLAREFARPGDSAPAWSELEWRIAEAAAAIHGVSSTLHKTLKWTGPARWQSFLDDQHAQTHARQQRIMALLATIDGLARRDGLPVTSLKGAALYALGIYGAGERPMADVDLLVCHADLEPAARLLGEIGYEEAIATWKHKVFMPRDARAPVKSGEHATNPITIDLHTRVFERLPVIDRDITDHLLHSRPEPGLNGYPSVASLMLHLLLHAAGNMRSRTLRMIQLRDIARLAARMGGDDWLAATGDRSRWWALPSLSLTARYYPQTIPQEVFTALVPGCPRSLRRACRRQTLTDVSLSNPWIEAFPGIEWTTTPTERIRYVISRVRPDRATLAEREDVVKLHSWMTDDPWTRMPQWRRILRWVRSRPPRVHTMHAVMVALSTPSTVMDPGPTEP